MCLIPCCERTKLIAYSVVENSAFDVGLCHRTVYLRSSELNGTILLLRMSADEENVPQVNVELTEADIPGASLDEPLEAQNVAALKWWLFCHGIKVPSSSRKQQVDLEYALFVCRHPSSSSSRWYVGTGYTVR